MDITLPNNDYIVAMAIIQFVLQYSIFVYVQSKYLTLGLLVEMRNTLFMMKIYVKLVPFHPYRIKPFPTFCGNKIV